ncbi:LOW QUALITY PROTEIN: vesicle-associated membrane protein/synaptobrevin-binding protein [Daphnia magna]|uniref:LOW QUALITY PROTEIN: vesicle-associated membrane protein/synaptobrevin-binding protein n=1 Tax=Daphnia magna TaxID=35525 RepID=UPI001E1BD7F4|nr:LOW QUALITY PROTEIN: vesicle-associated membrane protein/synaptobrevin-binding protein [Daphnia magna]
MSKAEAILKIEPENELRFRGPFKEPVSVVMKLSNNVDKKVCFKVKTTAPKRYCVKPTTGVIGPKEAVTILVTLQPFDPNDPNEKGKHKFQVLSVLAPEGEFNIETLWKETSLEIINDWKLKCVLETPDEAGTAAASAAPTVAVTNSASAPALPVAAPVAAPVVKTEEKTSKDASMQKVSNLELELRKASDEITRLREELSSATRENIQLKEEGLRLRRSNVSSGTESAGFKPEQPPLMYRQPGQDSVATVSSPNVLYIVAALLLGIIIAKLFF